MSSPAMFIPPEFKSRLKHVKEDLEAARQRSSTSARRMFFLNVPHLLLHLVRGAHCCPFTVLLSPIVHKEPCQLLCSARFSLCFTNAFSDTNQMPSGWMIAWKPHWVDSPIEPGHGGDHRDCFPEAALPVAQDSHREVCSREQRRSKRSSCVNLLLTMMSAIISENMQLVAGDFNSGAGATPGELCGSLKPPHSHCWKIPNMVPGVSTWPGSPRGRLRVPACLGKIGCP